MIIRRSKKIKHREGRRILRRRRRKRIRQIRRIKREAEK